MTKLNTTINTLTRARDQALADAAKAAQQRLGYQAAAQSASANVKQLTARLTTASTRLEAAQERSRQAMVTVGDQSKKIKEMVREANASMRHIAELEESSAWADSTVSQLQCEVGELETQMAASEEALSSAVDSLKDEQA